LYIFVLHMAAVDPRRWAYNFAYVHGHPIRTHMLLTTGDGQCDFYSPSEWSSQRAGTHGSHTFCTNRPHEPWYARFRYLGSDAPDLVNVAFRRDDFFSYWMGNHCYGGHHVDADSGAIVERPFCLAMCLYWMDYEPTLPPEPLPDLLAILDANHRGWRAMNGPY
jgi:hypothetical protein